MIVRVIECLRTKAKESGEIEMLTAVRLPSVCVAELSPKYAVEETLYQRSLT